MRRDASDHPLRAHGASGGCFTGKQAFSARREAKALATLLRRRGGHVRPYQCGYCHLWHVGHLPRVAMVGAMSADAFYGRTTT